MNIEKYLALKKYLLSLFGVSDFRDLQEKLIGFEDLYKKVFGGKGSFGIYELKKC